MKTKKQSWHEKDEEWIKTQAIHSLICYFAKVVFLCCLTNNKSEKSSTM